MVTLLSMVISAAGTSYVHMYVNHTGNAVGDNASASHPSACKWQLAIHGSSPLSSWGKSRLMNIY